MTSANHRTAAPGIEELGEAPSACGQSAIEAEPTQACGQSAVEAEGPQTCGQALMPSQDGQHRRLDQLEMDSWRAFLAASTAVTARLNHELEAGCGISMHEYEILVRLMEAPEGFMRMSTLADNVAHSRSRLTHTVGRLEKQGYVMRVSCASDKRGVNCELTDAGRDFLRQAAPIHLDGVRRHVVDRLSREQLEMLCALMTTISESPDSQAA